MSESVSAGLRKITTNLGRLPTSMEIRELRHDHRYAPSQHAIRKVGGHISALREAGYDDDEIGQVRIGRSLRYPDKIRILEGLYTLTNELGRLPHRSDLEKAAKTHPDLPSRRTLDRHFGSLTGALEEAGAVEAHYRRRLGAVSNDGPVTATGNIPNNLEELRVGLNYADFAHAIVDTSHRAGGLRQETDTSVSKWSWFKVPHSQLLVELTDQTLKVARHRERIKYQQPYYYLQLPIHISKTDGTIRTSRNGLTIQAGGQDGDGQFYEFSSKKSVGSYPPQINEVIQLVARDVLLIRRS